MSYVDKNLIPGEGVLYRTGLHWIVLVLPILVAVLFGLPAVLILIVGSRGRVDPPGSAGIVGSVLLAFAVTSLLVGILKRSATEMAVTNKRVVIKTGILTRRTYEVLLSKVESIHVEEGLLGRMLGYGSVIVRGIGGTPEPFRRIARPLDLRRQVHHQIEAYEEIARASLAPHPRQ